MRSPVNRSACGLLALGIAGLLTACSASAGTDPASPASDPPAIGSTRPAAAVRPADLPPGVTFGRQASRLRTGPFTIEPLHCGTFTPAEQKKFGTSATGGLTYRFTNTSRTATGAPALTVDFHNGKDMVGSNVTGDLNPVGPGHSGTGEVDAVGLSREPITFDGCQLMGYAVATSGSAAPFGNFAP